MSKEKKHHINFRCNTLAEYAAAEKAVELAYEHCELEDFNFPSPYEDVDVCEINLDLMDIPLVASISPEDGGIKALTEDSKGIKGPIVNFDVNKIYESMLHQLEQCGTTTLQSNGEPVQAKLLDGGGKVKVGDMIFTRDEVENLFVFVDPDCRDTF